MVDERYDAVVVGGGHNGLVTASYLARAGRRVCVVERRDVLGGACVTEEVWPGYRISRASYVVSLLQPKIVSELELKRFGYKVRPCNPGFGTITPHGKPLLLWQDAARTAEMLRAVSARDAERWPAFEEMMERVALLVRPLLLAPPTGNLQSLIATGAKALGIGKRHLAEAYRIFTQSIGDLLDDWFENDAFKGALASTGVVGVWAGPRTPGTAYNLLHHWVGEIDGVVGAWGQVEGGMGGISTAIARSAEAYGAVIRTGAPVRTIDVADGRAVGVTLESGETVRAPIVAASAHPKTVVLGLVGREHWPDAVVRDLERFRTRGGSVKVNMVVSELPRYDGVEGVSSSELHTGDLAFCPTIDYLERAWDDARQGHPSAGPYVEVLLPSVVDPTLVDEGKPGHVMTFFTQYGPPLEDGWPEGSREGYGERCLEVLRRYAPNMTEDVIIHREVLAPPDLERIFGLLGGNIFHGEQGLDQLAFMRPSLALARYRTPIAGLYLCGSGSHPGGGVSGAPGHNAARRILADGPILERVRRRLAG
jgi:phytoene dehydrogenase-like protein